MRVLIIGAGKVGSDAAADLADDHDVVLVDQRTDRIETLADELGIHAVAGDGRSLAVLEEAGVEEADVLLASTDSDETNIMVCGAAANITADVFTVARVKRVELYETWRDADDAFGIDLVVCSDLLVAEHIVRTVALPGARAVETFADGRVEMATFTVDTDSPVAGERIADTDRFPSLTFAGIVRDGDIQIPSGETTIEVDDRVVVIGTPGSVRRFASAFRSTALSAEDTVMVIGGGELGYQTAREFEMREFEPTLVEVDPDRANALSDQLDATTVLTGDATSMTFLRKAGVADAALLVSTLDETTNYLTTLLARHLGTAQTVAVVDTPEQVELFETVGIDVVVQPRTIIASEMARVTRGARTEDVAFVESDRAEVLELIVNSESVLAGESIMGAAHDFPDGFVIGAIIRNGTYHMPRGGTIIQAGDRVIAFVDTEVRDELASKL